jgi:hypothetical protein
LQIAVTYKVRILEVVDIDGLLDNLTTMDNGLGGSNNSGRAGQTESSDQLNQLISEIKELTVALDYFEKYHSEKDFEALAIVRDAITFRATNIQNRIAGNHQMTFPTSELINLITEPKFIESKVSAKRIHELIDFPIQSLHKFALSEILRTSVPE